MTKAVVSKDATAFVFTPSVSKIFGALVHSLFRPFLAKNYLRNIQTLFHKKQQHNILSTTISIDYTLVKNKT
jgi:hypothetical protein